MARGFRPDEKAAEERMHILGLIRMDPLLEDLRAEPRFQAVAERVSAPQAVPRRRPK